MSISNELPLLSLDSKISHLHLQPPNEREDGECSESDDIFIKTTKTELTSVIVEIRKDVSDKVQVLSSSVITLPTKVAKFKVYKDLKQVFQKTTYSGCDVFGAYNIIKKIGEGTFGEVSKAKHKTTQGTVALKKILIHNEKEGIPITSLREIKILKSLKHDNIVPLLEIVFEHGDRSSRGRGTIYMVFPFLDHDLTGLLENPNINLTQSQIKSYIQQLLSGSNVLISNTGTLMIADFGLARIFTPEKNDRHYTNNVVTRWYRPPELFLGQTLYDASIDMWGVGCVIGEMFKRSPIFPGATDLLQLECIFETCGTPTETDWPELYDLPDFKASISSFGEEYPRRLNLIFARYDPLAVDLMDRLLQHNPKSRFTAEEALSHCYFTREPSIAKPNTSDFSVYPSSHEYTTRLLKRENHDTQKHTQGTTSQNGHPKSHYATDAHVQKYKHYSSKEEEMIAIRVDSQNSAAAHLLKSMAPQRSVRTEIDSYYGNIDTKYTNTDRRTFNTTHQEYIPDYVRSPSRLDRYDDRRNKRRKL